MQASGDRHLHKVVCVRAGPLTPEADADLHERSSQLISGRTFSRQDRWLSAEHWAT